jgi:hypothetical protein
MFAHDKKNTLQEHTLLEGGLNQRGCRVSEICARFWKYRQLAKDRRETEWEKQVKGMGLFIVPRLQKRGQGTSEQ